MDAKEKYSEIRIEDLSFSYSNKKIFDGINLSIKEGSFAIILGMSGSGKTTLFNLINGSIKAQSGDIKIDNQSIYNDIDITTYRKDYLGYVFQDYKLLENLTAYDNIRLPLEISKKRYSEKEIISLAEQIGIQDILKTKCSQLSGGEKQRVAIARAVINQPKCLLADEPTGNLDGECKNDIMNLLQKLNNQGLTILMITHDTSLTQYASMIINMEDLQKNRS